MANYYEILGVPRTASTAEVRTAYLRLARERHPDRFPDPAEKAQAQEFFKDLTTAFNTLSNDRRRQEYDQESQKPKLAPKEIARQAFETGVHKLKARDFHEAVQQFRVAVRLEPGDARYHAALSLALSNNPHWVREAIDTIEAAIKLDPARPAYQAALARLLHGQGLTLRARKVAEAALRLAPQDPEVARIAAEIGVASPPDEPPPSGGLRGLLRRKP